MSFSQSDHFSVLQKICENITDSIKPGTAAYIYAAAVYDSWVVGSDLEKNIVNRLVEQWHNALVREMNDTYSQHVATCAHFGSRYALKRMSHDEFCKEWVEERKKSYVSNMGLLCALRNI